MKPEVSAMRPRLLSKPCATCGDRATDGVDGFLGGHPACPACREQFGGDVDLERLARVRAYRAERGGRLHLDRLLTFGRG